MICDFGDVAVVPFPFVDRPQVKRRPSAILSSQSFNEANGHSICAMITTASGSRWPSDITITDLASAGLSRPCVLRWKLFTLPNALILRKAGFLAADELHQTIAGIRSIMD